MHERASHVLPKAKKSVALVGIAAGNTALCTVGRTGNDLQYRGYDIKDLAKQGDVRGDRAPAGARRAADRVGADAYKQQAASACAACRDRAPALELLPATAHPMDVMRTGCSVLGTVLPEREGASASPKRATSPTA